MSSPSTPRRRVQRYGLAGIGAAVLFVGIASPAAAATDVVIPLEPTEIALAAWPAASLTAMDPLTDPDAEPDWATTEVQFGGTLAVDLPEELDTAAVVADLVFDDNGDDTPEAVYSSGYAPANSRYLPLAGRGTGTLTVTLPADDPTLLDAARLELRSLTPTLGPAFTFYDPATYELAFDPAASAAQTVSTDLFAIATLPCDSPSWTGCAFPTPVTVGSTVELDLTAASIIRDLGITDLTGVEVGLYRIDPDAGYVGDEVTPAVSVSGATASFLLPADSAPGQYQLTAVLGGVSDRTVLVQSELTVIAPDAAPAPAAPTTAAPATQALVNPGLRSNTGVVAPAEESSAGVLAGGLGLLAFAGAGGVAVARTRRPAATGTGEA
jgi:hypothetical protein